jgi:hypothetical protein
VQANGARKWMNQYQATNESFHARRLFPAHLPSMLSRQLQRL